MRHYLAWKPRRDASYLALGEEMGRRDVREVEGWPMLDFVEEGARERGATSEVCDCVFASYIGGLSHVVHLVHFAFSPFHLFVPHGIR